MNELYVLIPPGFAEVLDVAQGSAEVNAAIGGHRPRCRQKGNEGMMVNLHVIQIFGGITEDGAGIRCQAFCTRPVSPHAVYALV